MRTEDFQILSQVGQALWFQQERWKRATVETLTAVSMLDLLPESALERTTQALLEKANREGPEANAGALDHPFYRLIPEERLTLAALHVAHWSYGRLSRVLSLDEKQVTALAWNARLRLSSFSSGKRPLFYPAGAKVAGARCPEYDATSPWTQKFLDDEMPARERIFLQNHMMACQSCRKALATARDLYFRVDGMLPIEREAKLTLEQGGGLERAWTRSYHAARDTAPTLKTAVEKFLSRPKIFGSAIFAVMVLAYLFFSGR